MSSSKRPGAMVRIRAEVIRLVGLIPYGRFTTYGSIALHMNCNPRHVAQSLSGLTRDEVRILPWHRVVASDARISRSMDPALAAKQRRLLQKEGMKVNDRGFIIDPDPHFHVVGIRREIW